MFGAPDLALDFVFLPRWVDSHTFAKSANVWAPVYLISRNRPLLTS